MLAKFEGLKSTFLSLTGTVVLFALLIHYQAQWQDKLSVINYLVYPVVVLTALFAAQFNRSRITLLSGVWLLYLVSLDSPLPWSSWLSANHQWLILTGCTVFALLAMIKDRGLLSIHGITRTLLIALCGGLAFGWLMLCDFIVEKTPTDSVFPPLLPYLPITLPLLVFAVLLSWRSIRQGSLTVAALLCSLVVWYLNHNKLIELPWSVTVGAMSAMYLLAVSIDSYFLAYRDDLTGLPTRRALNQLALSLGRKYTVAMLDIDHFKKFNDTYGHDIGDQVLKLVAAKLATVKGGGKVFRYGGEEFTVVFPRKTAEQAIPELEHLRQAIADYAMVVRNPQRTNKKSRQSQKSNEHKTVSVTVSIGLAQRQAKQSFEQAIKVADEALYRAKKRGRNNVSK